MGNVETSNMALIVVGVLGAVRRNRNILEVCSIYCLRPMKLPRQILCW